MAVEIQHDGPAKFALAGLDLNVPVDLVAPTKYSRATNVVSKVEGRLETRDGTTRVTAIASGVLSVTITSGGFGYGAPPPVAFSGGGGSGAAGIAVLDKFTHVVGVTITNPGNGYTSPPTVAFQPFAGGAGAAGTAVIGQSRNLPIHTLFRLAQFATGILGERLIGAGTQLLTAPLPAGNAPVLLSGGPSFDGSPLSILQFRFDADPAGAWAIIANANGMMKRRAGYYQQLGVPAPTIAATASAGSAGLLDSSSGTGYDWRYTYLNEVTLSESNGSPVTIVTGGTATSKPTAFTNPSFGVNPFLNPGNAFDGNLATSATLNLSATSSGGVAQSGSGGCVWLGVPFSPTQYSAISLLITSSVDTAVDDSRTDPDLLASHASAFGTVEYSTDGGASWTTVFIANLNTSRSATDTIVLPNGTNLANVQVRSYGNVSAKSLNQQGSNSSSSLAIAISDISLALTLAAGQVSLLTLVNQQANLCVAPPTDPQETAIRFYRRGGTLPDNYFQVAQVPVLQLMQGPCGAGLLQFIDNVPDSQAQLGQIMPQDNFMPISSVQAVNVHLPVIFGPYDERVLGCGDPARPESVYFSNRGNADLWGAEDWVVVANPGEQMMNGIVYSLRCFAFSRERLFILLPNIVAGVTFTPSETSCRRGLKGRWALAAGELGVYFVSKDGVYRTQGGPEQSVIDDSIRPLFPVREGTAGVPTNGYDAVDMTDEDGLRLTFHNGEIWFFYTGLTTQVRQLLIYDERRNRWRGTSYADGMNIVYSEPSTTSSLLFGAIDGDVYQVGGNVDGENNVPIPVNFRTGAFDQGRPLNLKEYLNVVIDIDPGGATGVSPVAITPLLNGETVQDATLFVTGSGRQRIPLPLNQAAVEVYAYNLEFDFAWEATAAILPVVYQYEVLYRHEPAEVTHWELPPTSFGLQGWTHLRDIYLMLRSSGTATLTVTPDVGPAQQFIVPSTAGAKSKVFIPTAPSKARSYAFKIDSAAVFRLYADESEVRVKQWLTKLGYQNVPIIGREQVGRPFGLSNV